MKLYLKTYGCQMNEYDSQKIIAVLSASHQVETTDQATEADILLLNTCSIREKAQDKVFAEIGRWRDIKKKKPHVIIGVGGCVASQEGSAILERAPYVDLVFGPQTIHRVGDMLNERWKKNQAIVDIRFPEIEKFDRLPESKIEGPTAYVTIMEGCSKYCSFCVVPYTRGEEISRPFDDVLAEVAGLLEQGVQEITLLGQNVNDYRGPTQEGKEADLALLLEYISAMNTQLRLRFMTSHPMAFSNRLIHAYASLPQLANHLHLPIQSGSDRILSAMKRGYTVLEFKAKIRKLRQIRPDISVSSDFIVGFPGETEDDFIATLNIVHELEFDHSYSFIYSPRPGTPAAQLPDDTPLALKKQRLALLQQRLALNGQRISERMIGTTQKVLVTARPTVKHPDYMCGRTENNRSVYFSGPEDLYGRIVTLRIHTATTYTLHGELVGPL